MHEIELFVIVDEDGSYVAHTDRDECLSLANDEGLAVCRHLITVMLNVPTPESTVVNATLPPESNTIEAKVS